MQKVKVSILHFSPLEYYPPILNLLNCLSVNEACATKVYTTKSSSSYQYQKFGISIKRFGFGVSGFIKRYYTYLTYNIGTFVRLLFQKPNIVVAYESNSILPAYWISKWNKKCRIFIHYHEYTSPQEIEQVSGYMKYILKKEKALLSKAKWISHTNMQRMQLFGKDHPGLANEVKHIMPNYPPKQWQANVVDKETNKIEKRKFIYSGAVGFSTMYLKEVVQFIESNTDYSLDIYSNNIDAEASAFLKNCSKQIVVKEAVPYFELPSVYRNYDIGLILYKGHIPNYIYNAPNKLFEYLVSGLEVWYPKEMIGCKDYQDQLYPTVKEIDFTTMQETKTAEVNRSNSKAQIEQFNCENAYAEFINKITVTHH